VLHPAPTGLVSRVFLALQAKTKKEENIKHRQIIFPFHDVGFRLLNRYEYKSSNDWIAIACLFAINEAKLKA